MILNSPLSVFRPLRSVIYVTNISLKLYDLKIKSFFLLIVVSILKKKLSIKKN